VQGNSGPGTGVVGINHSETGLAIPFAAGVRGKAPGEVPGVHAVSGPPKGTEGGDVLDKGVALRVDGKARFSTAGAGTIPTGQNSVSVFNPAVTADSHITVTLVSNPGNRVLRWVERNAGAGFTVNLLQTQPGPKPATGFTYLIVEPAA
jgi:hypothetical protein